MITEDYVSFETAKLLKEKGFEGRMHTFYTEEGTEIESAYVVPSNFFPIYRPTLQMAMKWLREVHHYYIQVMLDSWVRGGRLGYYVVLQSTDSDFEMMLQDAFNEAYYQTYEEAAETAIKYCLENLI